ncbi:hypothetical protein KCP70_22575 [Salmonella enterica subsp. enterica]|nr:hypothetical protein KCP70_22575 [Salmonella enterica subsp. enterica]
MSSISALAVQIVIGRMTNIRQAAAQSPVNRWLTASADLRKERAAMERVFAATMPLFMIADTIVSMSLRASFNAASFCFSA